MCLRAMCHSIPLPLTPPQLQEVLLPPSTHVLQEALLLLNLPLCGKRLSYMSACPRLYYFYLPSSKLERVSLNTIQHVAQSTYSPLSPVPCLFFFVELKAGNSWLLSFINSEILSVETCAVIIYTTFKKQNSDK